MKIEQPKKPVEQKTSTQKNEQFDEVFAGIEDDFSNNYLVGRQVAHEYHSPAIEGLKKHSQYSKNTEDVNKGLSPEEIKKQKQGLEEPWVDPVSAFAGGFGGAGTSAIRSGMKLLPSFGRAVASGVIGAVSDVPVGVATEEMGLKYPGLALPFNVITGMVSGMTIERAIEKRIIKVLGKGADPKAIKKGVKKVRKSLDSGTPDEIGVKVLDDLQGEVPLSEAKKAVGSGVPKSEQTVGEAAKKFDKAGRPPKTDKYAININMERIETTDDIDSMLRKTAETFSGEIDEARRGIRTNKETSRVANLVGMTAEQLLKRKKGQAFNAENAVAARRILVSSADNLASLAKKVTTLEATDLDKFEFRKALNLHYAIQAQVSGMTAEAGRALQSFNMKARSSELKVNQIKDFLTMLPGGASTEKMAEALSSFDSPEQIGTFVKQVQRATTTDMFLEAWINGLLSGPQTHAVNMMSNAMNAVWQVPERFLAATIGRVTGSNAISEREAISMAYGLVEGFSDGIKSFGKVVRSGEPSDVLSKIETSRFRSITAENIRQLPLINKIAPNSLQEGGVAARAVDILGEAARVPGRFLMAEDELFKSIGYRMELRARAIRTAIDEGLDGEKAAKRIQDILSDPEVNAPDVHLAAIDAARYQTFTRPLESRILQDISKSRNPILKVILPFVRTPTNILKFGFERTPLAPLMKGVRADIMAGGAQRDLALARMSLGSIVMAAMGAMAASGKVTGGGPSNPNDFATWRRLNQPYSIKIGDTSLSYSRIEPMGMLFGLAADFTQIAGLAGEELQPEVEELGVAIVGAISKNITSRTWLRGLSEAIQAMSDPDRYGNKYIQNFAKSLVPTGLAQVERTLNPELEAVYSIMDSIKSRIPGLSKDLPRRRDLWGEPISTAISDDRGWAETVYSAISPIYIAREHGSPIDDELLKEKIHINKPQRTQSFEGIKLELTPHQYDDFIVWMNEVSLDSTGKNLKDSLNNMVQRDGDYKNANSDQKEIMIRNKFMEAKELTKIKWLNKYPQYKELINQEHALRSMS